MMAWLRRTLSLFLFVIVAVGSLHAQATPPPPKAVLPESTYNFGSVSQGTKVQYDFTIKNDGGSDLLIQRLVPACGCTAASFSSDPITPGSEGKIHIEFDTSGFAGEKLKTIRVYTNDTENPSQLLTISGNIEPDVSVEPASVVFEEVVRGAPPEEASREVVVKVREGSSAKIIEVKSFSKFVSVKETESTDRLRRLVVSVDPSAPPGEVRERITVNISGSKNSSLNIPVFAVVKGQIVMRPSQLSFGVIEGTQEIVRTAKLENLGKTPIRIQRVDSDNPALQASVKTLEDGKSYQVQVRLDPAKVNRDLRAVVQVVTDSPDQETVALNVYGILPPRR